LTKLANLVQFKRVYVLCGRLGKAGGPPNPFDYATDKHDHGTSHYTPNALLPLTTL